MIKNSILKITQTVVIFIALLTAPVLAAEVLGQVIGYACSGCHGSDGQLVMDEIPRLTSQSAGELEQKLLAFKYDIKPASIMGRISKGYTDAELKAVALPGWQRMSAARLESAIKNALDIHRDRYQEAVISKELDQKIIKLMTNTASCRALRNKFAHYLWMRRNDQEIFSAKMSGKLPSRKRNNESVVVLIEELEENYNTAHSLVEEIKSVVLELPKVEEERNLTNKPS